MAEATAEKKKQTPRTKKQLILCPETARLISFRGYVDWELHAECFISGAVM